MTKPDELKRLLDGQTPERRRQIAHDWARAHTWRCPTCGADYHDPPGDPPVCMFDHAELVPDA